MDHVYARIKRLRSRPFRRMISNASLFEDGGKGPDDCLDYSPSTLLDEDDWFKVQDFSQQDFFPEFLKREFVSSDVADLQKDQFEKITYLMSVQGGNYFFQRVRPTAFLRRKTIVFGDVAVIEEPLNRIVVNPQADALFIPDADVLLFRDLVVVSTIFPGIDSLYREATDDQVRDFLGQDFISVKGLESNDISKPNRKRIALAMETLGLLSKAEKSEIFKYLREYSESNLKFDETENIVTVATDEDVKNLVYGIEQRFYTTRVGGEKRLANSVVRL